jgi:hypothetical protein
MVMVTVMVMSVSLVKMMVLRGSERRTGKHHENQGRREKPFHGTNLAREQLAQKWPKGPASREQPGARALPPELREA